MNLLQCPQCGSKLEHPTLYYPNIYCASCHKEWYELEFPPLKQKHELRTS